MIDGKFASRLSLLEQKRLLLINQAAGYRLRAFDTIGTLAPYGARVDMAVAVVRYAREHWAVTGTLLAFVGLALRKRIDVLGVTQLALRLGTLFLAR